MQQLPSIRYVVAIAVIHRRVDHRVACKRIVLCNRSIVSPHPGWCSRNFGNPDFIQRATKMAGITIACAHQGAQLRREARIVADRSRTGVIHVRRRHPVLQHKREQLPLTGIDRKWLRRCGSRLEGPPAATGSDAINSLSKRIFRAKGRSDRRTGRLGPQGETLIRTMDAEPFPINSWVDDVIDTVKELGIADNPRDIGSRDCQPE